MSAIPTDKQKTDQIIEQCLVKAAHVVLGSRYDSSTPPRQQPGRKTWVCVLANKSWDSFVCSSSPEDILLQFCLDIDEVDIAAQVFDHWRTDTSTPAYIEVQPLLLSQHAEELQRSLQFYTCTPVTHNSIETGLPATMGRFRRAGRSSTIKSEPNMSKHLCAIQCLPISNITGALAVSL